MSERKPLMPKATAVWLVDNTALTFEQIAEFCGLHNLEVKGIADGDVAQGIKGMDPVTSGQLTRDEIKKGEEDSSHALQLAEQSVQIPEIKRKRAPRYTPVSRRQDRPNAVLWLLRNHEELKDSQIIRLVGTTKPTIQQIRDRTHWNSSQLQPQDPVTLGLCSQTDLDGEVQKAARRLERERKQAEREAKKAGTLLPAAETTAAAPSDIPGQSEQPDVTFPSAEILTPKPAPEPTREQAEQAEEERVFQKLQEMSAEKSDGDQPDASAEPADGETAKEGDTPAG